MALIVPKHCQKYVLHKIHTNLGHNSTTMLYQFLKRQSIGKTAMNMDMHLALNLMKLMLETFLEEVPSYSCEIGIMPANGQIAVKCLINLPLPLGSYT